MLASAVLVACSSESSSGDDGAKPELEGELCVDVNDACCCDEELELVENGPSCRINFAGDLPALTFELVTASGATVLPEVASAAACGAEGGWFISSTSDMFVQVELCDATCEIRQNEPTSLRVLTGCPATPC